MLADGVEAKVRAPLHDPTPVAISDAVSAIIHRRLEEGQLHDAPITLRQLAIVHDQFVRILTGMHHGRVEYPTGSWRTLTVTPSSTPLVTRECVSTTVYARTSHRSGCRLSTASPCRSQPRACVTPFGQPVRA